MIGIGYPSIYIIISLNKLLHNHPKDHHFHQPKYLINLIVRLR